MDRIEQDEHGVRSFIGPDAVEVYRLRTLIAGLKLEMKGIRITSRGHRKKKPRSSRVSCLKIAKSLTGLKTNDRAKHIERLSIMFDNAVAQVLIITKGDESVED